MKIATIILLTIILSFTAGLYLPWQSIALVSFVIAVIIWQKPGIAYVTGFVSMFLLWALLAWWIDAQNNSILSVRMAALFQLGRSSFLLIVITGLVAGIVGGLSALSGSYLRKYLDGRKKEEELIHEQY